MPGARNPFAIVDAEIIEADAETAQQEEEDRVFEENLVFNEPPADALMYYLLIKRRPRQVFAGSALFIGADLADAKKNAVEQVFGTGFPNTDEELLERYNVDIVEFTDDWENKLNEFANSPCPL